MVCRQLGFVGYKKVTHSGLFGPIKRKYVYSYDIKLLADSVEMKKFNVAGVQTLRVYRKVVLDMTLFCTNSI